MEKKLELVQYLVEEGIDINCKNSDNQRPIDYARSQYKNKEIYEYLKKKEDELNAKSINSKKTNKSSFSSFISKIIFG